MPDGRLVYPIFKNGSSSIKGDNPKFLAQKQIRDRVQHVEVYLREPFDRYVSGVQTFLRNNPELDRETALAFVGRFLFFDRHFCPQFYWLVNLARLTKGCWITLNDMTELGDITENTWNVLARDQELYDRLNQIEKLHFYLGVDKVLFHELKGQCLTMPMILAHIKVNHSELYQEVIQRSKTLCGVLD